MENTVVATNRKAFHEYIILDQFEAGIQLKGSEVKSIREGKASLKQAYILIRKGEAWLRGSHIASYSHTGFEGHEPVRDRKLLLHKKEIQKINLPKKLLENLDLSLFLRIKFNFFSSSLESIWSRRLNLVRKNLLCMVQHILLLCCFYILGSDNKSI